MADAQYDQLWIDNCAAVVGEEAAAETAEALKSACMGTIYGQEAIDAYGDSSNGAQFDCYFINGVKQFTFDGNTVTGTDLQALAESGKINLGTPAATPPAEEKMRMVAV